MHYTAATHCNTVLDSAKTIRCNTLYTIHTETLRTLVLYTPEEKGRREARGMAPMGVGRRGGRAPKYDAPCITA